MSADGHSAYVTAGNEDRVYQYTVAADGTLSPKTPDSVGTGSNPFDVVLSPDGKSAYVTNLGDSAVAQYTVAADGTLTPKTPASVSAGRGAIEIAVAPGTRASTTTVVVCSPGTVRVGQPTTCTATVTTSAIHPTGTVTFASNSSGSLRPASCTLAQLGGNRARCSVTYTPTRFGTGSHRIYANYSGDATNGPSHGYTDLTVT